MPFDPELKKQELIRLGYNPSDYDIADDYSIIKKAQPAVTSADTSATLSGPKPGMSALKAAGIGAKENVGGTLGGLAAGAAASWLLGPEVGIPGTLVAIGSALAGSYAGGKGQQAIESSVLSPETQQSLASERQQAEAEHPGFKLLGAAAPSAIALRPDLGELKTVGQAFTKLPGLAASETLIPSLGGRLSNVGGALETAVPGATRALTSTGLQAGIGAGSELAMQSLGDQPIDWTKVGLQAGANALLNKPYGPIGTRLFPEPVVPAQKPAETVVQPKVEKPIKAPTAKERVGANPSFEDVEQVLKTDAVKEGKTAEVISELDKLAKPIESEYRKLNKSLPKDEQLSNEQIKIAARDKVLKGQAASKAEEQRALPIEEGVTEPVKEGYKESVVPMTSKLAPEMSEGEHLFKKEADTSTQAKADEQIPASHLYKLGAGEVKATAPDAPFLGRTNPPRPGEAETGTVDINPAKADATTVGHEGVHLMGKYIEGHGSQTMKSLWSRVKGLTADHFQKLFQGTADDKLIGAIDKAGANAGEERGAYAISQRAASLHALRNEKFAWIKRTKKAVQDLQSTWNLKYGKGTETDLVNFMARRELDFPGYWESGAAAKDLKAIASGVKPTALPTPTGIDKMTELAKEAGGGEVKQQSEPIDKRAIEEDVLDYLDYNKEIGSDEYQNAVENARERGVKAGLSADKAEELVNMHGDGYKRENILSKILNKQKEESAKPTVNDITDRAVAMEREDHPSLSDETLRQIVDDELRADREGYTKEVEKFKSKDRQEYEGVQDEMKKMNETGDYSQFKEVLGRNEVVKNRHGGMPPKYQEEPASPTAITPEQDSAIRHYHNAAKSVAEMTSYGMREIVVPKKPYYARWSNATESWDIGQWNKKYAPVGSKTKVDANVLAISADNLKQAKLIAKHLPELSLNKYSFENNPAFDGGSNKEVNDFYNELISIKKGEAKAESFEVDPHVEKFMDNIRSPEQSKYQEETVYSDIDFDAIVDTDTEGNFFLDKLRRDEISRLYKHFNDIGIQIKKGKWWGINLTKDGEYLDAPEINKLQNNLPDEDKDRFARLIELYNQIDVENELKSSRGDEYGNDKESPKYQSSPISEEKMHYDPTEWLSHRQSFSPLTTARYDKIVEVAKKDTKDPDVLKSAAFATETSHKYEATKSELEGRFSSKIYSAIEDSGMSPKETTEFTHYLHEMDNAGESSIRLNAKQEAALVKYKEAIADPRNLQNEWGMEVREGDEYRAGGIKPEGYFMNMLATKYQDALVGTKALSKFVHDEWLAHAQSKGWTKEQFNTFFDEYKRAVANKGVTPDVKFGALRKAEGIGLPWSLTEQNLAVVSARYARRAAADLAFFKHIQDDPRARIVFNEKDQHNNWPEKTEGWHDISNWPEVIQAMNSIKGYTKASEAFHPVLNAALRVNANLIMGPGTAARNLLALPTNVAPWTINPIKMLSALGNSLIKEVRNRAYEYGSAKHSYLDYDIAGNLEGHPNWIVDKLNSFSQLLRRGQLREASDKFEGIYLHSLGELLARDWFNSAQRGNKESIRFLRKLGDTVDGGVAPLFEKGAEISQDVISKIAKRFVDVTRGTYSAEGLPSWAIEGSLTPFAGIQRFAIEKSNRFYKDVIVEAKTGNWKPALRTLFAGWLSATAIEQLNQLLSNKRSSEPTKEETEAAGGAENYARRFIMLAQMTSAAGIISDTAKLTSDLYFGKSPRTTPLSFPAVNTLMNVTEDVANLKEAWDQGEDKLATLTDFAANLVKRQTQTGRYLNARLDEEGTRRKEKMRDYAVWKEVSGQETPDKIKTVPNDYVDRESKDYKRTSDISSAMEMVPELISKALSKASRSGTFDPESFKQELMKLKRNSYQTMPSPQRMPLTFLRYLDFLDKTQGSSAASARFQDYVQQNALNRAKSSVLP